MKANITSVVAPSWGELAWLVYLVVNHFVSFCHVIYEFISHFISCMFVM